MVRRRLILLFACAVAIAPLLAPGAPSQMSPAAAAPKVAPAPTAAPSPSAAEASFLKKIMTDLPKRYPTTQAAVKAGYLRYSNEDETGPISYANPTPWYPTAPHVPAPLWYAVNGRLVGRVLRDLQVLARNGPALEESLGAF